MNNIDWEDVENKISIICRKFDNLRPWHDDLAQELRIHAYYMSDDYYDLYRKAIDFWRKIQTNHSSEVPYYDLDVLGKSSKKEDSLHDFDKMVSLVNKELNREGYNKWDNDRLELARFLFSMMLEDIDPRKDITHCYNKSTLNHYFNERLNLSWVYEETGIGYKRLIAAMQTIEDIIRGLAMMQKIDIPSEFMKGYYENN